MAGVPVSDARRSVRLRVRAPAELRVRGLRHDVVVEDLAVGGCRITSPVWIRPGEAVYVTLFLRQSRPLAAAATVVWSAERAPHHTGVSFARAGAAGRERCVRLLLRRDPSLSRAAAPLRPGQRLRLGAPPPAKAVLGRDELAVLRAARDGETALALLEAAGARFREVRAALETLRARGLVHELPSRPPAPGWEERLATTWPEPPPPPEPVGNPFAPAGRPLLATCCLEAAREAGAHGHVGAAVEWLQQALAAAPGDAEIAAALDALTGASG